MSGLCVNSFPLSGARRFDRLGSLSDYLMRPRESVARADSRSERESPLLRVRNWQNGTTTLRWTAAAFEPSSKGHRRIVGYELWILKATLEEPIKDEKVVQQAPAGQRDFTNPSSPVLSTPHGTGQYPL